MFDLAIPESLPPVISINTNRGEGGFLHGSYSTLAREVPVRIFKTCRWQNGTLRMAKRGARRWMVSGKRILKILEDPT